MKKTRTILFFIEDSEIHSFKISLKVSTTLIEALQFALTSINLNTKTPGIPLKIVSGEPLDYILYDWDQGKLSHDILVSEIPEPGIIMSIKKSLGKTEVPPPIVLKMMLKDRYPDTKSILDNFLSDPDNKFKPFKHPHYDVFISYSNKDNRVAAEIRDSLGGMQIKCFMAEKDIPSGIVWEKKILNALKESSIGVILLTPNSVESNWVMCETGAFWALDKPLITPYMYVDIEKLPEPIKKYQCKQIITMEDRKILCDEIFSLCKIDVGAGN
ncbi:MAG: toll/interleukin-1 receptor domain-containing protein [Candidatus Anammoxibacter sp.]